MAINTNKSKPFVNLLSSFIRVPNASATKTIAAIRANKDPTPIKAAGPPSPITAKAARTPVIITNIKDICFITSIAFGMPLTILKA